MLTGRSIAVCLAVALCGTAATAATHDFNGTPVDIEYWCGYGSSTSGTNEAVCVVDYADGNSFAFGYKWPGDETRTGYDMLAAADLGGALEVDLSWWDDMGAFIDAIEYDGNTTTNWWAYWTSADGQSWDPPTVGMSGRTLSDGDWDGWSAAADFGSEPPAVPAPEPASMGLFLLAGVGLLRRRHRR
ncbi:MAG: PEP-CTERM sorting domain-containing protein [Phycisphaerae bacterium]|nr:PEP-CTERM sorting domain-containing protein [Phycisphaerae bacterium]